MRMCLRSVSKSAMAPQIPVVPNHFGATFFTQMCEFFSSAPVCVGDAVNTHSVSLQMFLQKLVFVQARRIFGAKPIKKL